jgi:hypothetical protein
MKPEKDELYITVDQSKGFIKSTISDIAGSCQTTAFDITEADRAFDLFKKSETNPDLTDGPIFLLWRDLTREVSRALGQVHYRITVLLAWCFLIWVATPISAVHVVVIVFLNKLVVV